MADQLDFFFSDLGDLGRHPLAQKFWSFHRDNPHVYEQIKKLSLKMRKKGRKHYGIQTVFEVLRWYTDLKTTDTDFKINNDYAAFYSRMLMAREPSLKNFFRTRQAIADKEAF